MALEFVSPIVSHFRFSFPVVLCWLFDDPNTLLFDEEDSWEFVTEFELEPCSPLLSVVLIVADPLANPK